MYAPAILRFGLSATLAVLVACSSPDPEVQAPSTAPASDAMVGMVSVPVDLSIDTMEVRRSDTGMDLTLPGQVLPSPENYAVVSAPIGGRVASIGAHEGERVRKGDVVLQLESVDYAQLVATYLEAKADEQFARAQVDRSAGLVEKGVSPQASLDRANAEMSRAEARTSAAFGRLRALDVPVERIESWKTNTRERPLLPVYAPISGVIDRHEIDLGTSVNLYKEMMTIVNPARVLVRGFLSPEDAPLVKSGDRVRVGTRSDGSHLEAQITTMAPALDHENKSLVANIIMDTKDGWPIPGQTVQLTIEGISGGRFFRIPMAAVFYDGDQPSVFVTAGPGKFRLRPVEVTRLTDSWAFVASGLADGEVIAVSEVFSLKALLRFGEFAE